MEELRKYALHITDNKSKNDIKFIMRGFKKDHHLTIGFYDNSKTVDVHIKNEISEDYEPIFKMTYFRFFLMARRLGNLQIKLFLDLLDSGKINPGRLKKHNLYILPLRTSSEIHSDILRIQKNGKKFRLNTDKNFSEVFDQLYSGEEVVNFVDEASFVYDGNLNLQGFIYNFSFLSGIYFITKKKYNRMGKILLFSTYNYLKRTEFENKSFVMEKLYQVIKNKYQLN